MPDSLCGDQPDSILGVQSCGCITIWMTARGAIPKETQKSLNAIVAEGGTVERANLDDIRDRREFLPGECFHDPKGWERGPAPDPNAYDFRFRRQSHSRREEWRVEGRNAYFTRFIMAGRVRKLDDGWAATEFWFNHDDDGANHGDSERSPAHVEHGFASKQDAGQWVAERWNERTTEDAKQRWLKREANPPERKGPVPTETSTGTPLPPFKVGEVWGYDEQDDRAQYLILDLPEVDPHGFGRKSVSVRARDLSDRDRGYHPKWTVPTWTYVGESCFPGMRRIRTAVAERKRQQRQAVAA